MATGLTALSFVLERKQGLLDRSLVAGMEPNSLYSNPVNPLMLACHLFIVRKCAAQCSCRNAVIIDTKMLKL